jgi:hypothetical protein
MVLGFEFAGGMERRARFPYVDGKVEEVKCCGCG